jgi:hypothetical protein
MTGKHIALKRRDQTGAIQPLRERNFCITSVRTWTPSRALQGSTLFRWFHLKRLLLYQLS